MIQVSPYCSLFYPLAYISVTPFVLSVLTSWPPYHDWSLFLLNSQNCEWDSKWWLIGFLGICNFCSSTLFYYALSFNDSSLVSSRVLPVPQHFFKNIVFVYLQSVNYLMKIWTLVILNGFWEKSSIGMIQVGIFDSHLTN